jgi:hypothetical protein
MGKFKIVFIDGKEIEIEAINFSVASVLAAYGRLKCGGSTHKELGIDEKRSKQILDSRQAHAGMTTVNR